MNKIHPQNIIPTPRLTYPSTTTTTCTTTSPSIISSDLSSTKETFTIWMKSLILGGNGCTVFDSKGRVVYRVDNYCSKYCNKVLLMDSHGSVLLTILRKKFSLLSSWGGYRDEKKNGASRWFQVRKIWKMTKKPLKCEVVVNLEDDKNSQTFKIEKGKTELSSCRIVDTLRGPIAEMKRKQSKEGVKLGDDVLTLIVEANVDQSLIMGLFVAFSLIHSRI